MMGAQLLATLWLLPTHNIRESESWKGVHLVQLALQSSSIAYPPSSPPVFTINKGASTNFQSGPLWRALRVFSCIKTKNSAQPLYPHPIVLSSALYRQIEQVWQPFYPILLQTLEDSYCLCSSFPSLFFSRFHSLASFSWSSYGRILIPFHHANHPPLDILQLISTF